MYQLEFNENKYQFERYPFSNISQLTPWNSSDFLLINEALNLNYKNILLLNDIFGIATTILSNNNPYFFTDSFVSSKSLKRNLSLNDVANFENIIDDNFLPKNLFEIVLIKIPKNLSYFEYQLNLIKKWLKPNTIILSSGMVKHLSPNTRTLLENNIGETFISPVTKKAILFKSTLSNTEVKTKLLNPNIINLPEYNLEIFSYTNTFSEKKLDNGTRFLIDNLPHSIEGNVCDFGCGNGIIGLYIKTNFPEVSLYSVDESKTAIKSTIKNFEKYNIKSDILIGDGLFEIDKYDFNWIISNPPFHISSNNDIEISLRHFKSIYDHLSFSGKFLLVYNNSLNYQTHLDKIFSKTKKINSNTKYTVLQCTK